MSWAGLFAAACAVGVPTWWLLLYRSPFVRSLFVPPSAWEPFQAVAVPDMLLALATGGLAVQLFRGRADRAWCGVVCGAWGYATAYAFAWARSTNAPTLGPILMLAAFTGVAAVCYAVVPPRTSGIR